MSVKMDLECEHGNKAEMRMRFGWWLFKGGTTEEGVVDNDVRYAAIVTTGLSLGKRVVGFAEYPADVLAWIHSGQLP